MSGPVGKVGEMKSTDKMAVIAKPFDKYGGKRWIKVIFQRLEWVPSFEDMYRLVQAICFCEDLKYPNGKGRFMVRDFLKDCCEELRPGQKAEERWKELFAKYALIDRNDL